MKEKATINETISKETSMQSESNIEVVNDVSSSLEHLGMKWFHFYYTIILLLKIFLGIFILLGAIAYPIYAISSSSETSLEPAFLIAMCIILIPIIALILTYIFILPLIAYISYIKHKSIGYYPQRLYKITFALFVIDLVFNIITFNILSIVYVALNINYFSKRKHLFLP